MRRIAVVPVTRADQPRLEALARAFHLEDGHPLDAAGVAALGEVCDGHDLARGWLVELDGRAVGYVILTLGFSIQFGGTDGFVDDLYLVPAARGRDIGQEVMRQVEAEALLLGVKAVHLVVAPENHRAQRLYHRRGFAASHWLFMSKRLVDGDAAPARGVDDGSSPDPGRAT